MSELLNVVRPLVLAVESLVTGGVHGSAERRDVIHVLLPELGKLGQRNGCHVVYAVYEFMSGYDTSP